MASDVRVVGEVDGVELGGMLGHLGQLLAGRIVGLRGVGSESIAGSALPAIAEIKGENQGKLNLNEKKDEDGERIRLEAERDVKRRVKIQNRGRGEKGDAS